MSTGGGTFFAIEDDIAVQFCSFAEDWYANIVPVQFGQWLKRVLLVE